ncbi:FUSC family protein [Commensalibacter oyaizuii]|uniref:FUSC family protein n=1 Tax=Commensalibacter oyaizuii TaxID=3043873 RepID=A0ABT6Q3M7_9PROT|nr:FUSC family protein [Commensalibacter sp. TBRC 16381]MDI2091732.1 FUSC family protein [Commensalibacter sp. TBRC 16381]
MARLQTVTSWLDRHLILSKAYIQSFGWIYAPSRSAFLFALRTTIASFLALGIALWMELDSPKWAPMTVWICARNTSRGETISKAYWRAVGTIFGAIAAIILVAIFPQQPWLFNLAVTFFLAVCVWFGTCMQSFKAYAMVLAGFTCAIIAFGSVNNPDGIFMLAMSRATYILLGVLSDSVVGRFFDFNLDRHARQQLNDNLLFAIKGTVQSVADMLSGDEKAVVKSQELFTAITNFNNTIEFRQIEMNGHDHTGDHAHAALFSVTAVLARSTGLSTQMNYFGEETYEFKLIIPVVQERLKKLLRRIEKGEGFLIEKQRLNALRWECRQRITDSFYQQRDRNRSTDAVKVNQTIFNDRILFRSLSELLGELQITLDEYYKSIHPYKNDHFNFHVTPPLNYSLAWKNCLRTFVAMTAACVMWYVTGWDKGGSAAALTGMGCARFCLFENPSASTFGWFKGSIYALIVGLFLTFVFIPPMENMFTLCVVLFIPTLIGGLGIANPKTLSVSASYASYLPYMLSLDNQARLDEVTFANNALSLFMGIIFALLSFRLIYPYSPINTRLNLRQTLLKNMRAVPTTHKRSPRIWLFQTTELLVTMIRQLNTTKNTKVVQAYHLGTMAVMMIGLNVLRLRSMIDHDIMTNDIKDLLRIVLRRISKFHGRYGRTVVVCHSVIKKLRKRELYEQNLAVRMEIVAAIACLTIIADSMEKNAAFLDVTHPFLQHEKWNE